MGALGRPTMGQSLHGDNELNCKTQEALVGLSEILYYNLMSFSLPVFKKSKY
jgi:hypothetical protein